MTHVVLEHVIAARPALGPSTVLLPLGAEVLGVGIVDDAIQVWFLAVKEKPRDVERLFIVREQNEPIGWVRELFDYVGTVSTPAVPEDVNDIQRTFHVFEVRTQRKGEAPR